MEKLIQNPKLAALGLLAATAVLLGPVGCMVHRNEQIAQALKAGVDPVSARCAFVVMQSTTETLVCAGAKK